MDTFRHNIDTLGHWWLHLELSQQEIKSKRMNDGDLLSKERGGENDDYVDTAGIGANNMKTM